MNDDATLEQLMSAVAALDDWWHQVDGSLAYVVPTPRALLKVLCDSYDAFLISAGPDDDEVSTDDRLGMLEGAVRALGAQVAGLSEKRSPRDETVQWPTPSSNWYWTAWDQLQYRPNDDT